MTVKIMSFVGDCPTAQLGDPTLDAKEILAIMRKQLDILAMLSTHYVFIRKGTRVTTEDFPKGAQEEGPTGSCVYCGQKFSSNSDIVRGIKGFGHQGCAETAEGIK